MATTKEERQQKLAEMIKTDRRRRKETRPGGAKTVLSQLDTSQAIRGGCFTTLRFCTPGTKFEVLGTPWVQGTLVSVNDSSARVILSDHEHYEQDTRISPSTPVCTRKTLHDRPRPKPKAALTAAAQTAKPSHKTQQPKRTTGRIFGHTCTRILYWMGGHGWTFEQAKACFEAFDIPVAESTIKTMLGSAKNPKYYDPAPLTEAEARQLAMAIE